MYPRPDHQALLCRAVLCLQVILMDHVDWLDQKTVQELANTLAQQVLPGGIVIWRSASLSPPYSKVCGALWACKYFFCCVFDVLVW
jgi:hypothetical protein